MSSAADDASVRHLRRRRQAEYRQWAPVVLAGDEGNGVSREGVGASQICDDRHALWPRYGRRAGSGSLTKHVVEHNDVAEAVVPVQIHRHHRFRVVGVEVQVEELAVGVAGCRKGGSRQEEKDEVGWLHLVS